MTQTDDSLESPELKCVFSTVNRDELRFDQQSEKSVETLTNSPTPGRLAVSAVFDHSSPEPNFEDWNRQTSELVEVISTRNKKKSTRLRLLKTKRACSA